MSAVVVTDTTALEADPEQQFDKNTAGEAYLDVAIEVKHNTTGITLICP